MRKISGKLLVIWVGSPIHRAKESKEFLAAGAAKRLHLERLPGYAPELNPQEGVWNAFAIEKRAFSRVFFTPWERFRKLC